MQGGNVPVIDSEKKRRLFVPGVCYLHTSLRVHAEGGGRGGGRMLLQVFVGGGKANEAAVRLMRS